MATVSKENMVFTVMVRQTVEPKHQKELVNLFKRMLPVFQNSRDGFSECAPKLG